MSEEDINFLISIQDLEQPDFDNACLERENKNLRTKLQLKDNIIKEVREYIKSYNLEYLHETNEHNLADILEELLKILDKENK